MIIGVGIDAVSIERTGKLSEAARKKIFSDFELKEFDSLKDSVQEVRNQFLASRFAAKEAYSKARGLGFGEKISPSDITVKKDSEGRPFIELGGKTAQNAPKSKCHLSITHEMPLAIAVVILED